MNENTVKLRAGQVWNCGKWGTAEIVKVGPKSAKFPGVDLKLVTKGEHTQANRKGDKLSLARRSFESGEYTRIA